MDAPGRQRLPLEGTTRDGRLKVTEGLSFPVNAAQIERFVQFAASVTIPPALRATFPVVAASRFGYKYATGIFA